MNEHPDISVIVPVFNEAGNIEPLHQAVSDVLCSLGRRYEILYCDDGSSDGSTDLLRKLAAADERVKVIVLRRNFGQTPAINAGIDHAQGDILILMDADRQNDPKDIPQLIEKLDEGFDIVSGWRKRRQDPFWTKVLPSRIANWVISRTTGVFLHDHGCTLKAYRREVLHQVSLYGEMHRFIPVFGHWTGAKVAEVEVTHHPRIAGRSKYTLSRTFKVLLDLPVLVLLGSYLTRPMHFFGPAGILCNVMGFLCLIPVILDKIGDPDGSKVHRNPLVLLAALLVLVGIQFIMMGLLAELITRVYHESQHKKTYVVRKTYNLPAD